MLLVHWSSAYICHNFIKVQAGMTYGICISLVLDYTSQSEPMVRVSRLGAIDGSSERA